MMDDIFDDMFDVAGSLSSVDTDTAKNLSSLVRELRKLEDEVADTEEHLKQLKRQKQNLEVEQIPGLMAEMGVDRLDVDGLTVSVKLKVHASIPVARREEAYDWLRQNNLDDIIKNDVTVSFGRGQDNEAGNVMGTLQDMGLDPQAKTHIHSSTLRAFVKERVENNQPIDLDLFGAYVANTAEIRRK